MTSLLDELQSKVEQVTLLFGYPADLSDPDNPAFEYRDRTYHVVAIREHTTKSGGDTRVLTLQATCDHCAMPFEYDTGWNKLALYANCQEHRLKRGEHTFGTLKPKAQPVASQDDFQTMLANASLAQRAPR